MVNSAPSFHEFRTGSKDRLRPKREFSADYKTNKLARIGFTHYQNLYPHPLPPQESAYTSKCIQLESIVKESLVYPTRSQPVDHQRIQAVSIRYKLVPGTEFGYNHTNMKQPRNHHHVPQFYFKPWANNRDKLWAFDRSNQRVIGVTIRDIASQRDFYGPTEAEAVLQPYEDHCKDVIENTLRGIDRIIPTNWDLDAYRPISAEYIEVLISLANFQYSRSLRTRLLIRETASRIISDKAKKSGIADPRFEDPETLSKQISKNWLAWQHVDLLSQHTKYLPCFRNKIFIVGVNSTGIKLVTSDNPLVKIGPDINAPANSLGLSSPGVRLSLPLSPWVVISMFDPTRFSALSEWHGQPKPLPESEVSLLNRAQLKQCVRHVYSADHNFSWTSDGEELTTK